jgi:hypothetical protein
VEIADEISASEQTSEKVLTTIWDCSLNNISTVDSNAVWGIPRFSSPDSVEDLIPMAAALQVVAKRAKRAKRAVGLIFVMGNRVEKVGFARGE